MNSLRVNVIPHWKFHACVKPNHPAYSVKDFPESPAAFSYDHIFFISHTSHSPLRTIQVNGTRGYGDGRASALKAGDVIRETKHSLAVDRWEPQRFYSAKSIHTQAEQHLRRFPHYLSEKSPLYKVPPPINPQTVNQLLPLFLFLGFPLLNKHTFNLFLNIHLSASIANSKLTACVASPGSGIDLVSTFSSSEICQSMSTCLSISASLTTLAFLQLQMRVCCEANVFIKHQLRCEWT